MQCLISEEGQPLGTLRGPNGCHLNSGNPSWPQRMARGLFACLLLFWSQTAFGVIFGYAGGIRDGKSDNPPRIYVGGPGTATLSDIKASTNVSKSAPLAQIAPGVWHLRCDIVMTNGARLVLHGSKIGGDVNELRLQSNNDPEAELYKTNIVSITADWGMIDIRSTFITSWDDAVDGPDTEYTTYKR